MATINELIEQGARMFRVTSADIIADKREHRYVRARFALYLAFTRRGASLSQIGRWMKRDHTTVVHGVKRAKEIEADNPFFAERVRSLVNFVAPEGRNEGSEGNGS